MCLKTISTPIRETAVNSRIEFDRSELSFDQYLLQNLKNLQDLETDKPKYKPLLTYGQAAKFDQFPVGDMDFIKNMAYVVKPFQQDSFTSTGGGGAIFCPDNLFTESYQKSKSTLSMGAKMGRIQRNRSKCNTVLRNTTLSYE